MRKRLSMALVGLGVAWTVGVPAAEAADHRTLGVGGFIGYSKASDADDGSVHFGGNLSLRLLEVLGGLVEVGYREDDLDVSGEGVVSDARVQYIPILFSGQLFPFGEKLNPFSPFLMGGIGFWVNEVEVDLLIDGEERTVSDREVDTGYHIGGGLDLNVGPNLTFTGDLRWIFLDTGFRDLPEADADGIWLTAGIKLFFN